MLILPTLFCDNLITLFLLCMHTYVHISWAARPIKFQNNRQKTCQTKPIKKPQNTTANIICQIDKWYLQWTAIEHCVFSAAGSAFYIVTCDNDCTLLVLIFRAVLNLLFFVDITYSLVLRRCWCICSISRRSTWWLSILCWLPGASLCQTGRWCLPERPRRW